MVYGGLQRSSVVHVCTNSLPWFVEIQTEPLEAPGIKPLQSITQLFQPLHFLLNLRNYTFKVFVVCVC